MEYIVNVSEEEFDIILFEYKNRKWEIMIDIDLSERKIQSLITQRIEELENDLKEFGHLDNSDLFKDYTIKIEE